MSYTLRSIGSGAGSDVTGYLLTPPGSDARPGTLLVPPFRLRRGALNFVLARELHIDVDTLVPDLYQILAVQDFWIEDENPDLGECLATIFLARRRTNGRWEEPENWPIECRTLAELGRLDCRREQWTVEWYRDYQHG